MLNQIKAYIRHLSKAGNAHGLHSPFVFDLYTKAIAPKKKYYIFEALEALRQEMIQDETEISVTDFGAGSKVMKGHLRRVADIARNSVGGQKESELLFRLSHYFQPNIMLELGTSLGLNTLYQLSAQPEASFYSFEGCQETAKLAAKNFSAFDLKPNVIVGNLDNTLAPTLENIEKVDWVFFDANHQYEPTLRYFKACLQKVHEESIFIFDDIYWTSDMERAWEDIKAHPQVRLTVDLFDLGLVFFRDKQPKQHFRLKY